MSVLSGLLVVLCCSSCVQDCLISNDLKELHTGCNVNWGLSNCKCHAAMPSL